MWGLVSADRVKYHAGRVDPKNIGLTPTDAGLKYLVPLPGGGGADLFDKVVLRHGPTSRLHEFGDLVQAFRGITEKPGRDRTRRQLYPNNFYPHVEPEETREEPVAAPLAEATAGGLDIGAPSLDTPPATDALSPESAIVAPTIQVPPSNFAQIERARYLTDLVNSQTRARNFEEAREAARQLEAIVSSAPKRFAQELWDAAHTALFDFERLVYARAKEHGEPVTLERLRHIVSRMKSGNH
jgi:hypothetical protein